MTRREPEVDEWFEKYEHDNVDALMTARDVILGSDDRVTETIKWSTPTFLYRGNILSFTASKSGVGLMFHRGSELPGRHPRLEGDGKLVRTMRFDDVGDVEAGKADIQAAVVAWCDLRDQPAGRVN
ncbi:MAG: DUF1801 domain-containing protein [Acidimicrobiia bacterium]